MRLAAILLYLFSVGFGAGAAAGPVPVSLSALGEDILTTSTFTGIAPESRTDTLSYPGAAEIRGTDSNAFSWMAPTDSIQWDKFTTSGGIDGDLITVSFASRSGMTGFSPTDALDLSFQWDPRFTGATYLIYFLTGFPGADPSAIAGITINYIPDDGITLVIPAGVLSGLGQGSGEIQVPLGVSETVPTPAAALLLLPALALLQGRLRGR